MSVESGKDFLNSGFPIYAAIAVSVFVLCRVYVVSHLEPSFKSDKDYVLLRRRVLRGSMLVSHNPMRHRNCHKTLAMTNAQENSGPSFEMLRGESLVNNDRERPDALDALQVSRDGCPTVVEG